MLDQEMGEIRLREIFCRIDRCLGCRTCELACAVEHSLSENLIEIIRNNALPVNRIKVMTIDSERGITGFRTMALQCRHCSEPACVEACIAGGITKDEATGIVKFNADRCVGCWTCTMVCQFGAVIRLSGEAKAIKCDRCEDTGNLACVAACPTHALIFCEHEEFLALIDKVDETV